MSLTHPDRMHTTFAEAVNAGDVDAVLDMYDTSGINVELDGSRTTGHEAMRASFHGLVSAVRQLEATQRKLFVADGVALTSGVWTAEIALPDGSIVTAGGTTAEVSVRQPDGTWRVVIDDPLFV